jgi:ABC-2 type transport system permease protein
MNLRRIAVLLVRELVQGPKNFIFVFALVMPIVLTLALTLVFGNLFEEKPWLGIVDDGDSELVTLLQESGAIDLSLYEDEAAMRAAVARGNLDMGIILPATFDQAVAEEGRVELQAYAWGESLLRDRILLASTLGSLVRDLAGRELPVELTTETVGQGASIPWEERLLPFIVLMAVLIGGLMVPATSLVEEKQRRTLTALTVTPTTMGDVLTAKTLIGILLALFTGIFTLALNRAWGGQPLLLLATMALGATFAASFGILLGLLTKDINTLFATIKGLGLILYAPALVYLFPAIPEWVGRIFPTYYVVQPVIAISQQGATAADVAPEIAVLISLIALMVGVIAVVTRRQARLAF